jgi:PKD repeat protein
MLHSNPYQKKWNRLLYTVSIFCCCLLVGTVAAAYDCPNCPEFTRISENGFGDPQNNYAWSMAEFKGDIYIGTGRNVPYMVSLAMKRQGTFPENMTLSFLTHPAGSPPPLLSPPNTTPPSQAEVILWSNDMRAEIWRYHNGTWTQVHQASTFVNPLDGYTYPEGVGYRIMAPFNDTEGIEALYAGVGFGFGRVLLIRSTDGTTWVPVNTAGIPSRDTRAMTVHNGKLYVGTGDGIFASACPSTTTDTWEKVADFQVASLKSFNGYLYAGTGNPGGPSETDGFEVWRSSTVSPEGPDDWVRVVSGGAGDAWNVLAASMQDYDGDLFVGSMNLPFGTGTEGLKGFDLIRVDTGDSWDLIVGNYYPKIPTDPRGPPLSGWPSGFANPFNLYDWSLEEYKGNLYLGTFDIFSFARYISEVPGGEDMLIDALSSRYGNDTGSTLQQNGTIGAFLTGLGEINQTAYGDVEDIIPVIEFLAWNFGGADLWTSPDGVFWIPVELNGFDDPNNYGFRTMLPTSDGFMIGTANPFNGCQVWIGKTTVPMVANFTADPLNGCSPLTVCFTDKSTGAIDSWFWDFGDNSTSYEQNPCHIYSAPGSYNVSLRVNNSYGYYSLTRPGYITVVNCSPPASVTNLHNTSYQPTSITWVWTDPTSPDLEYVKIYLDGVFQANVEKGVQTFTALSLTPETSYEIGTRTAGITGNLNSTWVNHTAMTAPPHSGQTFNVLLPNGWNLFSTPILLEQEYSQFPQIFSGNEQEKILIVLGWDGSIWYIPAPDAEVKPLDAFYVRVSDGEIANATIVPSKVVSGPPARTVTTGLNFIGFAAAYDPDTQSFQDMPLTQALVSIEQVNSLRGYSIVISPGLNQPGWTYALGGPVYNMKPFKGYWVIMENGPDNLYGFSTTPIEN